MKLLWAFNSVCIICLSSVNWGEISVNFIIFFSYFTNNRATERVGTLTICNPWIFNKKTKDIAKFTGALLSTRARNSHEIVYMRCSSFFLNSYFKNIPSSFLSIRISNHYQSICSSTITIQREECKLPKLSRF